MSDFIKALSMWRPWASLWLSPNKRHETRHWETSHRGQLLVHAAKTICFDIESELEDILLSEFGGHWGLDLPRGAIIGIIDLVDVIPTEKLYDGRGAEIFSPLSDEEATDRASGDFGRNRFGWRRGSYRRFAQPIPYRGRQRLFNVPRSVVAEQIAASVEVIGA